MINQSDCTIIIPHLGATEKQHYAFNECWKSLRETVPEMKIVVAKNGLESMGEPIPIDFYDHASKIALSEQGQCRATNGAISTTNTPWVFVTNDDMIYAPRWWERLVNNIEEEMCVSPQLVEPNQGAPTFQVQKFGGAGGDFNKQKWLEFAEFYPTVGEMRTGFNLPFLIKRELWDTIGGYDINYDPWSANSDSDLEYRIRLAGVQPYQNTNCIVYHFSQTSGTFHPDQRSYWDQNWYYFINKWGFERASGNEGIWEATMTIPDPPIRKYTPEWEGKYARQ